MKRRDFLATAAAAIAAPALPAPTAKYIEFANGSKISVDPTTQPYTSNPPRLWITNIDYERKIVTLGNEPPWIPEDRRGLGVDKLIPGSWRRK